MLLQDAVREVLREYVGYKVIHIASYYCLVVVNFVDFYSYACIRCLQNVI